MTVKHVKEVTRQIKRDFPGVLITPLRQRTHHVMCVEWRSKSIQVVMGSSPKNTDHAVYNTVKYIKQRLQA